MEHRHRRLRNRIVLVAIFSILVAPSSGTVQDGPLAPQAQAAPPSTPVWEGNEIDEKIAPRVREALTSLQQGEMITVIVTLKEQADLTGIADEDRATRIRRVIEARQLTAEVTQEALRDLLETRRSQGRVDEVTYFWILNGLTVTATRDVIEELAEQSEVFNITLNETIQAPVPPLERPLVTLSATEANLAVTNASALWDLGFRGQGIVVANMDTGVDINHPDLAAQWRGGTNSWFDPNGEHPTTPTDVKGHGTWTMGVMVGRDTGGTAVGVAPDAQWVAVKIFNDQNYATVEGIHKGFQWLLDPDDNPNTPDAPHVANNSWGYQTPGCNLEFQLDLQALRAAGILPIFAAGNSGPGGSTSISPANYPEAFAVGATDNFDLMYPYSSRGPSACGEAQTLFPEVVAPGTNIYTTDLLGIYTYATGTSLAAPHVAGALALLLSAYPDLTVAQQEATLISGAVDLGPVGADNDYGHGRLDVLAAYQAGPPCPAFADPPAVGVEDIQAVAGHWRQQSTDPGWGASFDLNQDGSITIEDIMMAVARLGETCL